MEQEADVPQSPVGGDEEATAADPQLEQEEQADEGHESTPPPEPVTETPAGGVVDTDDAVNASADEVNTPDVQETEIDLQAHEGTEQSQPENTSANAEQGTTFSEGRPSSRQSITSENVKNDGAVLPTPQEGQVPQQIETEAQLQDDNIPPPSDAIIQNSAPASAEINQGSVTDKSVSQIPGETQQVTPDIPLPPALIDRSETSSAEFERTSPNALVSEEKAIIFHNFNVHFENYIIFADLFQYFFFFSQNMQWSFGMNKNIPVINITDQERQMIVYACAHTGILYDMKNNKQILLQGHVSKLFTNQI